MTVEIQDLQLNRREQILSIQCGFTLFTPKDNKKKKQNKTGRKISFAASQNLKKVLYYNIKHLYKATIPFFSPFAA